MPEVPCRTCHQPDPLLSYRTYGDWTVQRPGHGCLGRFTPDAVRLQPDGRTFDLGLRFDRAAYQLYRDAGATHETALDNALLCGAWCGAIDVTGRGAWEMRIKIPDSPYVEYVGMLWPEHDTDWPRGEINLLEGRAGTGRTQLNLHWGTTEHPEHAPATIALDVTQWHTYRVELDPGIMRWRVDGRLVRAVRTPHVPHDMRLHMVIQCGVHPSIADAWTDSGLDFHEAIQFQPLLTP